MTENAAPAKPAPQPDAISAPFWEAAAEGRLLLMRCSGCGERRLPAGPACPFCLSEAYEWEEASGRGTVHTFGVMHQRYHPAFEPELPYNLAIVELEEGPRLPTNLRDVAERRAPRGHARRGRLGA